VARELALSLQLIPVSKLVVGLETVQDSNGLPYTSAQLQQCFDALAQYNISPIAIWDTPIPYNWWRFLEACAARA
jgi:hypothetical protein